MKDNPPVRAWLESLTSGIIEFTLDWSDAEVPAVRLAGRTERRVFAQFERAARHAAALRYGYFVDEAGRLVFVLPREATREEAVYVAGDFNGWEAAVGQDAWKLTDGELAGMPVRIWCGPAAQFWTDPPARFKFVTAEHQWINVSADAPNAADDGAGHINHVLDPERTGRQVFRFTLAEPLDLSQAWTVAPANGALPGVELQPGEFFFALATDLPLGASVRDGQTVFRLFAPRARGVRLLVSREPAPAAEPEAVAMDRHTGEPCVWEAALEGNLHGWFYWFELDGPAGAPRRVLDPYALAAVNHEGPGIVVDRAQVAPGDRDFRTPCWQDLVIAEAHVRDLTARAPLALAPEERLGFTGLRKWVESPDFYLEQLGVNCVELQPVQEFDNRTREEYHWGYMPVNWFAPASAYALEPGRGSGIGELQALVRAFHRKGMAVLLDVVFNHVGQPNHLQAIDPLYYFAHDAGGGPTNWSGCGNDVRASAAMAQRLIIDACTHLIETFGVDGFRFDLAELLGPEVLRRIEQALKRVKPDVVLIAEPWSFRGHIAGVLRDTGWSSWNDGYRNFLRNYVRGGETAAALEYFIKGSPWFWAKWPAQTVNYVESHDDRAWIDLITENADFNGSSPTTHDRHRTHLMVAVLMMSIGIPMLSAGQDFLRSKEGLNNTYQRGDINALDYRRIYRFPGTQTYFAEWIAFRRGALGRLLRLWSRPGEGYFRVFAAEDSTACAVLYNADNSSGGAQLLFAVNPGLNDVNIPLDPQVPARGGWRQLADQEVFHRGLGARQRLAAPLNVPALGCGLWARDK